MKQLNSKTTQSNIQGHIEDQSPVFQFKGGLYTLSALQLLNPELPNFEQQLNSKIQQAPKFFHNAPIVIDLIKVGSSSKALDFQALKEVLTRHRLIPVGVKGGNSEQHAAAIAAGFAVLSEGTRIEETRNIRDSRERIEGQPRIESQQPAEGQAGANKLSSLKIDLLSETALVSVKQSIDQNDNNQHNNKNDKNDQNDKNDSSKEILKETLSGSRGTNTRVITEPVRSGQQIYARGGDLLILAPVSHGAELLADGHIHVYGPLRGRALAGVSGDTEAHILCQSLEAELISIAGQYKISEDIESSYWQAGVDISLVEDRLQIRIL